jgi:crotonobetainyl-CoA:carnitine CoA-transferase CaiB-like acyl-CoA transferase
VRGLLPPTVMAERGLGSINPFWEQWNGSKRAVTLDLAKETAREIVGRLLGQADVLVTNFRPIVVDRFGLDYQSVAAVNPKIIYAQATGFGSKGPDRDRAAFDDTVFWLRAGIMSTLGEPDAPPVPLRGAMGDLTSAVFLAGAIVTALFARDRSGLGQKIDISLLSTGMWVAGEDVQRRLTWGERGGNRKYARKAAPNPLRNTYQTADGRWLFFMMLQTDRYWPAVCRAIGREDLQDDARFDSHQKRVQNHREMIALLDKALAARTLAEWAERFEEHGLVWEPETTIAEVVADPQVTANDLVAEVPHPSGDTMRLLRVPFQFGGTPIGPRAPAPELGQHTEEVLLELGYDWDDLTRLKDQGVIL